MADAIRTSDDANLREELGDLLLQVVMHAQIASEDGRFTIEDVAERSATNWSGDIRMFLAKAKRATPARS